MVVSSGLTLSFGNSQKDQELKGDAGEFKKESIIVLEQEVVKPSLVLAGSGGAPSCQDNFAGTEKNLVQDPATLNLFQPEACSKLTLGQAVRAQIVKVSYTEIQQEIKLLRENSVEFNTVNLSYPGLSINFGLMLVPRESSAGILLLFVVAAVPVYLALRKKFVLKKPLSLEILGLMLC